MHRSSQNMEIWCWRGLSRGLQQEKRGCFWTSRRKLTCQKKVGVLKISRAVLWNFLFINCLITFLIWKSKKTYFKLCLCTWMVYNAKLFTSCLPGGSILWSAVCTDVSKTCGVTFGSVASGLLSISANGPAPLLQLGWSVRMELVNFGSGGVSSAVMWLMMAEGWRDLLCTTE